MRSSKQKLLTQLPLNFLPDVERLLLTLLTHFILLSLSDVAMSLSDRD
ncbi:hypothetical protein [Nostoc sp. C057]|nr:hypothetical protein [Nostoc sp. C057]